MEVATDVSWGIGLVLVSALAWLLNLIALPGNWVAVALLALYAWLGPDHGRLDLGWPVVAAAFLLALVGEIVEFAAGALGAQRAGASRRSTLFAIIGSVAGALLGAIVGIPIPVVGSLLAAILFGAVGATAGAMYGEWSDGKSWRESWTIGHAAFWGRLLGTLGKLLAGALIVLLTLAAVLL
jgi:uncharacterized protein YqgC (DUF456 family)